MAKMRNIVVVDYDPNWPAMFEVEAAKVAAVFGDELLAIHHIGSTSIAGMRAKSIIDMMPVVRDIERVDQLNEAMIELGYRPLGENEIAGRRYFVKGDDAHRTHHVHSYQPDHPEVKSHIDFRDYLIAHPDKANKYAELKMLLAKQYPHDIDAYIAGKDAFIKEIIEKARVWRADKPQ